MAIVVKDRVQQTSTTTGTSDFLLTGTVAGFQTFAAIGNTNVTYYSSVDPSTGDWEVGIGTYSTTGPTLARTTVLSSSASGSKVSFGAGPKVVFCAYPSEKAIYEEVSGNVLIDGGPITVVGNGVTSYTTFSAALGELYANVNNFAQFYAQNLNGGSEASGDFVAYRNDSTGTTKFVDLGINSSNYSSVSYPIFTAGSAYLFNNTGEMFIGSETDDLILFAGGVATNNWALRVDKTTQALTTKAALTLGGALTGVGGSFTSPVTTTSSMSTPGATEFVTKTYVDDATSSALIFHTAVQAASVSAFNEAALVYNNGTAGVGATLTRVSSFITFVIDGYFPSVNQRVLIKDQTTQAWNGIYTVTTVGSPSVGFVLTRATDADTAGSGANLLSLNDYFYVQNGTVNKGTAYVLSAPSGTITFGTSNIQFAEFSSSQIYTGTSPINVTSTVISLTTVPATLGGTGTATVTTGDLLYGSGTNTWAKLPAGAGYRSLVMNAGGTQVEWNAVALDQAGAVSGALPATSGGTGQTAYTVGDILYSGATNTLAKLAGNTSTTKKILVQTGTGSASAAPAWDTLSSGDIGGLGTMATQNANSVAITGGSVNNTTIGNSTPATGAFTTLTANSGSTVLDASNFATYADPAGTAVAMAIALG